MQFENAYLSLESRVELLKKQLDKAIKESAKAERYLSTREEVEQTLDKLEYKIRGKILDNYSKLLTFILNDILPAKKSKDRKVKLSFNTYRSLPALNIHINNDSFEEDVMRGQGGAVANIFSTALRLIALHRSGRRKFIILDEPDCWIKPDYIMAFSEVIKDTADKLGIQTLYISHHEASNLVGADTVNLSVSSGKIISTYKDFERGNIKYIRLRNFLSHTDTYIPLSKSVTLLVGENNIGKSNVAEGIRAIAYGEHSDSLIKHGEKEFTVEIGVEDKKVILRRNFKKHNNEKVVWQILDSNDNILIETHQSNIPDEVVSLLNIYPVNGIDIQINNQKTPVFLIDRSPAEKAKILNIGGESKHLIAIREEWKRVLDWSKKTKKKYKEFISSGTILIADIDRQNLKEKYSFLIKSREEIELNAKKIAEMESFLLNYERLTKNINKIKPIKSINKPIQPDIDIRKTISIKTAIQNIESLTHKKEVLEQTASISKPQEPEIKDVNNMLSIGKILSTAKTLIKAFKSLKDKHKHISLPETIDEKPAKLIIEMSKKVEKLNKTLRSSKESVDKAKKKVDELFVSLGHCPLCGSKIEKDGEHYV